MEHLQLFVSKKRAFSFIFLFMYLFFAFQQLVKEVNVVSEVDLIITALSLYTRGILSASL